MGKKTRERRQPQQLVSRIEKDLGELLSDGSVDRESVRTALEHVHALRNGGVPFPEETLSGYIKRTRPGYTANHTPSSASKKLTNISKAVHEAGLIQKRRKKVRGTKLFLAEGDVETRQSIDTFLDKDFTEDGIKKRTEEIELLTDYLRENRPTYFSNSTEGGAYQKAIRIAKVLREAGIIERREPIGAATLYLDKGDEETRASIDEYLNENYTEDGNDADEEAIETVRQYLLSKKPKYFARLTKNGKISRIHYIIHQLLDAGIIEERERKKKSKFWLGDGDEETRASIDEYLDENLTEDGIKKIRAKPTPSDSTEKIEILTSYLRENRPTYFTKLTKTSAYNKAIKIAKNLHEAGKIKKREPIGAATLYLDKGDTETRQSIDEYLDENLTEKGIKKRTEEIELLTDYLRKTKPTYFTGLTKPSAKNKAARLANKLRKAGIIKKRKPIGKVIFYLDKEDTKTRQSIDEYLDKHLTEDEGGERADDTDEVELLTDYLRKSRPKYFANSTEGGAYQKAIKIAKVLHEAGIIERREQIGRATLYLDKGDTETRASIDEYLNENLTEDGKNKRTKQTDATDYTDEKEEVELLTDYLRKTKPTYFTGLTKPSAKNKAEKIANKLHEAGKIKKRKPVDRVTLYLDDGDEATRASIDEYLDKNLTEDGIKKRRSTEEVELLTNYLIENRPTYFTGLTERSAKNKAEKIAKGLREAGKIKKREPVGRATLYLDKGDTETRQSIDEYLNENLTEDGKKKIIGRPLKEQPPKKWEDVGGVERTDNEEPDENDLAAIIDESDEDLEEYKPKVRKRSKQPSLAGRVKKKATRSPRKVDPLPDFETIGHFIERERPHILGLHTPIQEKVRILEGMIDNMEKKGVVEKRQRINEAEYFLLDHEDDKRVRILDYLDKLSIPPQAVEQRKPEHDGTVASYLSGRYLSGLDKRLQLQTLNEWIKNLNEDDIIQDGEDPLSPELQDEIDGYIEHLQERARKYPSPQQRTKEDPSPQQRTKEDPSPQQRTRKDPSQCTLEDIAEKIGIPVAIVESYNYELIGMSINRNIVGRIVNGIRLVTNSYDGELMSMENIVEETRIPLKYLKWFDMRVLGKYIQIVQNGKKICEGWDSARATTFIESVRMPWKGERGYNTKPAK